MITCISLLLGGCSNAVVEQANKAPKSNDKVESKKQKDEGTKIQLHDTQRTPKEIVDSMDKEEVTENTLSLSAKEEYTDANEFAIFVGDTLRQFYEGKMSPEQYYDFIQKYGSSTLKIMEPSKKDEAVVVYTNVQELLKKKFSNTGNYVISTVDIDSTGIEGHFYRQWETSEEVICYITTIVKQGDVWKYQGDQPSTPVVITNKLKEQSEE
jgi:hypothetical protein